MKTKLDQKTARVLFIGTGVFALSIAVYITIINIIENGTILGMSFC
ncbi:hypothetical protein [Shouchella patagoniensis]|nr:hypothetical protein [Shouchella patagoniensis]